MSRLTTTLTLVCFLANTLGCATMCQPGPDMIPVNSKPTGASVSLDGVPVGTTPMTVAVPRDSDGVLTIKQEGYKTVQLDKDKVLNGWFFPGDLLWILLWPAVPISMATDLATHNQGKYQTAPIYVELTPGSPSDVILIADHKPGRRPTDEGASP